MIYFVVQEVFRMNFMEWLTKEGFTDSEIGNILCYFRKLQESVPEPVKLAAKFILDETDRFQTKEDKRSAAKVRAGQLYQKLTRENSQMKKSEKVRKIAVVMNVKNDCIYAYLRELNL